MISYCNNQSHDPTGALNLTHKHLFKTFSRQWCFSLCNCWGAFCLYLHKQTNVCIYSIFRDVIFKNSSIATCKLHSGTHSSGEREKTFERWSCYGHFKMNNNFSPRTICRGVKIFSRALTLALSGLLCAQICSKYRISMCSCMLFCYYPITSMQRFAFKRTFLVEKYSKV